ncbi:MAG: murein L,D-transpeptidase catalytic domain family protein [Dysgonamonadaceae bacterium]|jgi:hypothetical protein|nr:murein L,D-transpeptidase catalytic domain family protein [Dysgonamonadaceae bacterium]
MQKRFICPVVFLVCWLLSPFCIENRASEPDKSLADASESALLYEEMNLEELINFKAFKSAYEGYKKLSKDNNSLLTLIDFSLPSTQKRLYVLDLSKKQVLFVSYVSHGKGSGEDYATSFSNRKGSLQSSLGFYRTSGIYNGRNGYSLLLDGLEKGINDKARPRSIVIHGADYCSEEVIHSSGRLGRSFGCPALPHELAKPIINTIKGGSLLFIYADKPDYFAKSKIVKPDAFVKNRL